MLRMAKQEATNEEQDLASRKQALEMHLASRKQALEMQGAVMLLIEHVAAKGTGASRGNSSEDELSGGNSSEDEQ